MMGRGVKGGQGNFKWWVRVRVREGGMPDQDMMQLGFRGLGPGWHIPGGPGLGLGGRHIYK